MHFVKIYQNSSDLILLVQEIQYLVPDTPLLPQCHEFHHASALPPNDDKDTPLKL